MRGTKRAVALLAAALCAPACGVTDAERAPVESVALSPASLRLTEGTTGTFDVDVRDAAGSSVRDRRVVWASSNPAVATVSDRGVVTAVQAGSADVAATAEGKSAIAPVTVLAAAPAIASVSVTPSPVNLLVAQSATLTATAYDSEGKPVAGRSVVWTTSNAAVAVVSQSGRVTGVTPGEAAVTATIDGFSGTATVTVALVPVSRVVVTPSQRTIDAGKTATLTARLYDAAGNVLTGRAVTWRSEDTRIATVDEAGVVRGLRKGTVTITATSEGKLGTAQIRVE